MLNLLHISNHFYDHKSQKRKHAYRPGMQPRYHYDEQPTNVNILVLYYKIIRVQKDGPRPHQLGEIERNEINVRARNK